LDNDAPRVFCAHLLARGRLWSGAGLAIMNAEWMGEWRLAPRAHPGDGLLDKIAGALAIRERLLARRRAVTGDHVPHPDLSTTRAAAFDETFQHHRGIHLDGVYVGRYRRVTVSVRAAAVTVAV
ncbi:MAG: hypothetical protein ACC660_06720, partial [Acidimicrobiales bacterium]